MKFASYARATGRRSERAVEDERLLEKIRELHEANYFAYGSGACGRRCGAPASGSGAAASSGSCGPTQSRGPSAAARRWKTTRPDPQARRRPDLVQRNFTAEGPDELSVADRTYLRCWEGLVFFAFVIDAYSRRIVGWQLAGHMRTTLVLDALRMALARRQQGADVAPVHHSDRGSQAGLNRSSQRVSVR